MHADDVAARPKPFRRSEEPSGFLYALLCEARASAVPVRFTLAGAAESSSGAVVSDEEFTYDGSAN